MFMKFVSSEDIMSYGDSKAVFKQRALFMGLTPAVFEKLEAKGFTTMALFAFSCNYSPGASTDKPFLEMISDTLGRDPSALEVSILRRLFSESYANVAADIRCQTEQTDETAARKLAPAERAERLRLQQERLPGLNIKGQYEPGDTLVDKCCAAYESDRIVYIEWSSCISREFELMNNVKKDANLTMTTDGTLKLAKSQKVEPMQSSNEIQIRYCLVRRGLALEQANILDFKKHDELLEMLMEARMAEPLTGYQRISLKQLELADKKFFALMGEETRAGIKAKPEGRPCDLAFLKVFNSPEFRHLLQPRLAQGASNSGKGEENESPIKKPKIGPKGGGKGTKGDAFQRVPTDLLKIGGCASTQKGNRLCFGFNLKSCKLQVKQQKCDRGLHLCCVRGCFKPHPALDCPNKKTSE